MDDKGQYHPSMMRRKRARHTRETFNLSQELGEVIKMVISWRFNYVFSLLPSVIKETILKKGCGMKSLEEDQGQRWVIWGPGGQGQQGACRAEWG